MITGLRKKLKHGANINLFLFFRLLPGTVAIKHLPGNLSETE